MFVLLALLKKANLLYIPKWIAGSPSQKRVAVDMSFRWLVQPSRVFYSHHTNAKNFNVSKNLTKVQCKQLFNKALAFQSRVDHRSYAQVLTQPHAAGLAHKHYQLSYGSRAVGSFTENNTVVQSKVVDTKDRINGQSYKIPKVTCQGSSLPNHNTTVGAHKQLQQPCPPTSHHKGSNHDANHFDISLCIRFESLADLQENQNLQLQSHPDEVISSAGGTGGNVSERIHKRDGQRTPTTSLSHTDNQQVLCTEYYHCKEQNGVEFGCVPLSPLRLFTGDPTYWERIPNVISAHKLIRASGLPNFLGLWIPAHTQLNVKTWRFHLSDYWDQQLLDLIEYGFPLDFDRFFHTLENHTSALKFSDHVDQYIAEELQHGVVLGPFDQKPCTLHVSPVMTREKSNSQLRRTIIDLSRPKGQAVNDGVQKDSYLGTKFEMHYPSVDRIVSNLNQIGPAAKIFKVDISRAFRHIKIDLGDIDLLELYHKGCYYIDLALPFGFRLGSFFFSKLSDGVCYIMKKHGHNALLNYLDDLIYCGLPSNIDQAYECLIHLLEELGLAGKKLHPPSTQAICLGIMFDTINRTISIPLEKLQEIIALCNNWQNNTTCTKANLHLLF